MQFQLDPYVLTFSGTYSRSGNSFFGAGVARNYPNPVNIAGSISFGWLNKCNVTPQDVDDFIAGNGVGGTARFYGIVGGGVASSPGSGKATLLGIGIGAGLSASPSYNQGATGIGGW